MAKVSSHFECQNCNYQTPKWMGCCPDCKTWNSIEEITKLPTHGKSQKNKKTPITKLATASDISDSKQARLITKIDEWDRVTGGGIVAGSFSIVTGDPGIGKSTLLLQIAANLANEYKVIYFSSEESLQQIKLRYKRIDESSNSLFFSDQAILESIIEVCQQEKPDLVIIDSIQNIYSSENFALPGTITQLKESTFHLMKLAKENNISVVATGHITKEGQIAGPKLLEHMVDAVFYLQKEDRWQTRILRSVKNRFGTVHELGFFTMQQNGMKPVENINQHMLEDTKHAPGSILISCLEGSRPIFLELQTLIVKTQFNIAQRVATGIDQKQLVLIAAILEKYLHIKFSSCDIFFKLSGGIKTKDQASDLGIALTLLSSYFQKPVPEKTIALGELSLTGYIKPVQNIEIHMKEAAKFGFENIFISQDQKIQKQSQSKIRKFKTVYDLLQLFPE